MTHKEISLNTKKSLSGILINLIKEGRLDNRNRVIRYLSDTNKNCLWVFWNESNSKRNIVLLHKERPDIMSERYQ